VVLLDTLDPGEKEMSRYRNSLVVRRADLELTHVPNQL